MGDKCYQARNCKLLIHFALIFLTGCICFSSYSQENIRLKGTILADSLEGSTIHIINKSQGLGTTSDVLGNFSIPVKEKDTLWFTSIQYEKKILIVSEENIQDPILTVSLKPFVNELETVNINNISLSGILAKDALDMKILNKYSLGAPLSTKPLPTQEERRLYTATHAANGILSVDYLINVVSGRLKELKHHKEISDLNVLVEKGIAGFPETYFVEDLNIQTPQLVNFIYFCAEDPNYKRLVSQNNKLALMEFYNHYAGLYKMQLED